MQVIGDKYQHRHVERSRRVRASFLCPGALVGPGRHGEGVPTEAESAIRDLVLAELGRG